MVGRRSLAAIVDVLLVAILFVLLAAILGDLHIQRTDVGGARTSNTSANLTGWHAVLFFALVFAYYWLTEAAWGQTVGKRLARLRVVCADGGRPGWGAVFVRNLLRPVDGLPILYLSRVSGGHGDRGPPTTHR